MVRISEYPMQSVSKQARMTRLMAQCCLGIIFLSGSACSGEPALIMPDSAPILVAADNPRKAEDNASLVIDGVSEEQIIADSENASQPELSGKKQVNAQALLDIASLYASEQLNEILALYRRLHIELDDDRRSLLIIDLFQDDRLELRQLGFELVDRDLSSSTVLKAEVGESAKELLKDPNPIVRSQAARLITRLVPLDAMIVLTESLKIETDSIAAEPMLLGIARWPNPEAVGTVRDWFLQPENPFSAACNAAWSLEIAGLWDTQIDHPLLINRLREVESTELNADGMKLIASFGDASDLEMLVSLLMSEIPNQQQWAGGALVETPRAVEMLAQAAEENDQLFQAAVSSLIRHRATPEGLRRLVSLPYSNDEIRTDAIMRMGDALELDRLSEAVGLADLNTAHSIMLLNRLLNGQVELSPSVSKGIVLLGEIQLDELRPNRAYEAAIALDDATLDPAERSRIFSIKAEALILMGKHDEAIELNADPEHWISALNRSVDADLRHRIATTLLDSLGDSLSEERIAEIRQLGNIKPPEPEPSEETPDTIDATDP